MPSDKELVRSALNGDADSAAILLSRHLRMLRALAERNARRLGLDVSIADDLLQDLYEKISRDRFRVLVRWRGLDDPAVDSIGPYLATILRNLLVSEARHNRRLVTREFDDEGLHPGDGAVAEEPDDHLRRRMIQDCIDSRLTSQQREVIALFMLGSSHREIAAQLQISEGNSRVMLRRAMVALRSCMEAGTL